MRKHIKNIVFLVIISSVSLVFSQSRENDTISTGIIDVIKPYKPSISDAFKVKETPVLDDETTETKKEVKYNIFSFPVASTFTPAKGKAASVEKEKPSKSYDNFASLGGGNYTNILGELHLSHTISKYQSVSGYLSHHSSAGGIKGVALDDNFSNSKVNVNYASQLKDIAWDLDAGFQHQLFNWYGLPENYNNNQAFANTLDVGHSFSNAHIGSDISFEDSYLNSVSLFYRRFADNQGSGENRFIAKSIVDIPVNKKVINTGITLDYLGGAFDRDYAANPELKYGNFQIGVTPTYQITQEDLTLDLGVSLVYLNNYEAKDSKVFIYPNLNATYNLVDDILMVYGGVKGGLMQNSYYGFATENPFVSPTLFIAPTDQKYNAYFGLQGKLSSSMSYGLEASYMTESGKPLFINNIASAISANAEDYKYGNSFGIVYDDVDTFGFSGEINADVNQNFKLALKAEYFSYSTDSQPQAWNLPEVKGSLLLDYQIDEHWFAGANLFYVGERNDLSTIDGLSPAAVVLDGFFDANVQLGYHINERLSVYTKGNNLANNNYQRWQNYQVQGIQFLAGATFKFDF